MTSTINQGIKLFQDLQNFLDWLGISSIGNARQHVEGLRRELEKEKVKVAEFIEISQTDNEGTAKKRFRAMMRKQKVEHDLTLIREAFHKVSATWIDGVADDRKRGIIGSVRLTPRRAELEHESAQPWLIKLHEMCKNMENGEKLLDKFERQYKTLGREQFLGNLYKFVEDIIDYEEDEYTEVALVEAIALCKGYYPEQLLDDFISRGEELGSISETAFNNYDTAAASGGATAEKAALRILTLALYRAGGGVGEPTVYEENVYAPLLSTEKNCPWGEEWIVKPTTRLSNLLKKVKLEKALK
jgi:hypothetical protein